MARIAVIDRRADVIALSQAVLVGRGHAVTSFEKGPLAFETLRLSPPDAVIAGSFEGRPALVRDVVRDVRALGPHVLAFLLVPGKGDERAVLEGLDAGADDVITVPFSAPDLAGRVGAALQRSRLRDAPTPQGREHDPEIPPDRTDGRGNGANGTRVIVPVDTEPGRARAAGPTRKAGIPIVPGPELQLGDDDDVFPDAPSLTAAKISFLAAAGEESQLAGRAFDRYVIGRTLGVGGMGI
ncbi:response regulator transcription factor, partial [bacterium]|nr:response regulator transcription factor [bacterium]